MRLLSLDYDPVYGNEATRSTFTSDISAFDYDVVIWDPAKSFQSYHPYGVDRYMGLPSFSEHTSVQIAADAKRRKTEFAEYINAGRTVVAIVRPPQACYVDTGQRTYSGTGRNRATTRQVTRFDLMSALPVADCGFVLAGGNRIDVDGGGPMSKLLRKYKANLAYGAVLKTSPGTPIARVFGTDRVVGALLRTKGGGHLVLLPALRLAAQHQDDDDDDDDDDQYRDDEQLDWLPESEEFQYDLLFAIEELSGGLVVSRPAWADRYATVEQRRLQTEIVKQQGRIEQGRAKLAKLQQEHEVADSVNQLFLGTGRTLELQVKRVLELLGGEVTEPAPGRDDWKVSFPEGAAVIEVKGVAKSAAEKHAAQLEKWVALAIDETDEVPKAVLVANTWRELPLDERTQEDFPDQMLPYSQARSHCLITGLQLFVIQAEVAAAPGRAEYWRKSLMETSGRISGCEDWRLVLPETKSGSDEATG